jgi:TonB-linked SusC/RagA family outer membrane protein
MTKHLKSFLGIFLVICFQVHAQITIKGNIVDDQNESVIGATIIVKGTTIGTVSDIRGDYSISVPENSETLIVSFIGYKSKEILISNRSIIDIKLEIDIAELESIVVTGYGSQRKQDITGAVAIVNTNEISKSQYTNVTDRLQGRVAGVSVKTNGEPGSMGDVTIRGISFFGDNNPLYVIDGIPTEDSPNINPADIETIQVLKDASSSAIYGSRAANGVVVITTKKGRIGKPTISFNSNIGLQQIGNKMNVVNTSEFARIHNAAYDNAGYPRRTWSNDLSRGIDTDWQAEIFNETAFLQDYNLSISGGNDKSKVYFNLNNTKQEGTIEGTVFERLGVRINSEFDLTKRIKIGQNLSVSTTDQSGQQILNAQGVLGGSGNGVINTAIMMFPTIPVYDPTRLSGYGHGTIEDAEIYLYNPVGIREMYSSKEDHTRILGNIFVNVNLTSDLEYRFNFGTDSDFGFSKSHQRTGQITTELVHLSGLSEYNSKSTMLLFENRLTYKKTFGNHDFSVMASQTEQEFKIHQNGISIVGGFASANPFFQISATTAAPTDITTSGDELTSTISSLLGRFTYNYDGKYLFTANVRSDGSSKFPKNNRWGTFPSISLGWNISKESFFQSSIVNDLKLRVGYGVVGNASIDDYAYQSLIFSRSIGGNNYNLGYDDRSVIGATRAGIVNNDLKWETLKETNIGIDLSLMDGSIEIIGDIYFSELEDLLVDAPVPGSAGEGQSSTIINAATMDRSGWEFSFRYRKLDGNFKFDITANVFQNENKVTYLPLGDMYGLHSITSVGQPIGQIYALDYLGIYTDESELGNNTVVGQTPELGDAKYQDISGDGDISEGQDRMILGDPNPKLQYGLNFSAYWRDFEFTIFFQGMNGADAFNAIKYNMNTSAQTSYTGDYDPFIDGIGTDPRPTADFGSPNNIASGLFVEDASYLRLKNVRIDYQIPWRRTNNLGVFIGGQNLLTFTKYSGMDPEFDSDILAPGVDWGGFPNIRIFNSGFNITF